MRPLLVLQEFYWRQSETGQIKCTMIEDMRAFAYVKVFQLNELQLTFPFLFQHRALNWCACFQFFFALLKPSFK